MHPWLRSLVLVLGLVVHAPGSAAEVPPRTAAERRALWKEPWSAAHPTLLADVRTGRPLTLLVYVPLCSNRQIACGGQGAGDPGSLRKNLYWGRGFGARRYFDESARRWQRLDVQPGTGPLLEQVVYRRTVAGRSWGMPGAERLEVLLVLRAVHGDAIDQAVDDFFETATEGGRVRFTERGTTRDVRVHVAGYAGHNRLMDGTRLPAATPGGNALPSFVLACRSDAYFSDELRQAGSQPLVMTRDLMAPEGYVIEALANALAENQSRVAIRQRVVRTYGRWQRLSDRAAATIFASP